MSWGFSSFEWIIGMIRICLGLGMDYIDLYMFLIYRYNKIYLDLELNKKSGRDKKQL